MELRHLYVALQHNRGKSLFFILSDPMGFFHLHAKIIGRSQGRYAVAAAAYRSGTRMYCQNSGQVFDYSRKSDVIRTGILEPTILMPPWAPDWASDREMLYNAVESAEKRRDAQLLREFDIAIPNELNDESAKSLVLRWSHLNFVAHHLVCDVVFHRGYQELNRHSHVLVTLRRIERDGFCAKKAVDMNHPSLCDQWRRSWEQLCNFALEASGVEERITRLSLEAQGIARSPQRHMGQAATAMRRRGVLSEEAWNESLYKMEVTHAVEQHRDSIDVGGLWNQQPPPNGRMVPTGGGGLQQLAKAPDPSRRPG